jgi:hypothetical protein
VIAALTHDRALSANAFRLVLTNSSLTTSFTVWVEEQVDVFAAAGSFKLPRPRFCQPLHQDPRVAMRRPIATLMQN